MIDTMKKEVEQIETYIMDVALASHGALAYRDTLYMPPDKLNLYAKRIEHKIKQESPTKGPEYL
jgi:hypothetical protein